MSGYASALYMQTAPRELVLWIGLSIAPVRPGSLLKMEFMWLVKFHAWWRTFLLEPPDLVPMWLYVVALQAPSPSIPLLSYKWQPTLALECAIQNLRILSRVALHTFKIWYPRPSTFTRRSVCELLKFKLMEWTISSMVTLARHLLEIFQGILQLNSPSATVGRIRFTCMWIISSSYLHLLSIIWDLLTTGTSQVEPSNVVSAVLVVTNKLVLRCLWIVLFLSWFFQEIGMTLLVEDRERFRFVFVLTPFLGQR